jgi:hypothetical protein
VARVTLKVVEVTQYPTDPTGCSCVVRFSRDLTHFERETVPVMLSMPFSPSEVRGADTVSIHARVSFCTYPKTRANLGGLVAEAESQAEKHLTPAAQSRRARRCAGRRN